jgi:anti-anti-sigma factor
MPSSRTPEGQPNHCFICKQDVVVEPSTTPGRDAPCPNCGNLLWFPEPGFGVFLAKSVDVSELSNHLEDWVDRMPDTRLVIDFRDVKFINSSMLGKLISLHRKLMARKRGMVLRNVRPELTEVFQITKLDRLFPFEGEAGGEPT